MLKTGKWNPIETGEFVVKLYRYSTLLRNWQNKSKCKTFGITFMDNVGQNAFSVNLTISMKNWWVRQKKKYFHHFFVQLLVYFKSSLWNKAQDNLSIVKVWLSANLSVKDWKFRKEERRGNCETSMKMFSIAYLCTCILYIYFYLTLLPGLAHIQWPWVAWFCIFPYDTCCQVMTTCRF